MPTLKVPAGKNIELSSSWKAKKEQVYVDRNQTYGYQKWVFASGPTSGNATISFPYSLPSGAVIKSATMWVTSSNPPSGCSVRTVNGNGFSQSRGAEIGAPVTLSGTTGTLEAVFSFRANGTLSDDKAHSSTLVLSNVYLEIVYEGEGIDSPDYSEEAQVNGEILLAPPQGVCIYDPSDGAIYLFDGVVKINHTLSMDLQEEPEGEKKAKYVNNAKNEPDKVTLDIVMSDVYSGGGSIIDNAGSFTQEQRTAFDQTESSLIKRDPNDYWSRSENAYYTLHWLKEERRKLVVITPQFVYTEMIIASLTVNRDENCPFGWEGQIVFQHAFEPKEVKKKTTKGGRTGDDNKDVTVSAQALNAVAEAANGTSNKSGTGD